MKNNFLTKLSAVALAGVMALTFAPAASLTAFAADAAAATEVKTTPVYRAYNTKNGEHLFTTDKTEYDKNVELGLQGEGEAWTAPEDGEIIYRIYNPNSGEHLLIKDKEEYDAAVLAGWDGEGPKMYSDTNKSTPVYRLFNPNAKDAGSHLYTTSRDEYNALVAKGWKGEGIKFYGTEKAAEAIKVVSAKQTSAKTAEVELSRELTATDTLKVTRGTSEVAISSKSNEGAVYTLTFGSDLVKDTYTVSVTDKNKNESKGTFDAEAPKLTKILWLSDTINVLKNDTVGMHTVVTAVKGADQWGNEMQLTGSEWTASKGTCNYDASTGLLTITDPAPATPYVVGSTVTAICVIADKAIAENHNYTVGMANSVAELKLGELKSDAADYKNATRVTEQGLEEGGYYLPVEAKDSNGITLNADLLNEMLDAKTLFITPDGSNTSGVLYGNRFVTKNNQPALRIVAGDMIKGPIDHYELKVDMPAVINILSTGAAGSQQKQITVYRTSLIDTMSVNLPSDLYADKTSEFTISATDQDGKTLDLYDLTTTLATPANTYEFVEGTKLTITNGKIKVTRDTVKKTVKFEIIPDGEGMVSVSGMTAGFKAVLATAQAGKVRYFKGVKGFTDAVKTTMVKGVTQDLYDAAKDPAVVFTYNDGAEVKASVAKSDIKYLTRGPVTPTASTAADEGGTTVLGIAKPADAEHPTYAYAIDEKDDFLTFTADTGVLKAEAPGMQDVNIYLYKVSDISTPSDPGKYKVEQIAKTPVEFTVVAEKSVDYQLEIEKSDLYNAATTDILDAKLVDKNGAAVDNAKLDSVTFASDDKHDDTVYTYDATNKVIKVRTSPTDDHFDGEATVTMTATIKDNGSTKVVTGTFKSTKAAPQVEKIAYTGNASTYNRDDVKDDFNVILAKSEAHIDGVYLIDQYGNDITSDGGSATPIIKVVNFVRPSDTTKGDSDVVDTPSITSNAITLAAKEGQALTAGDTFQVVVQDARASQTFNITIVADSAAYTAAKTKIDELTTQVNYQGVKTASTHASEADWKMAIENTIKTQVHGVTGLSTATVTVAFSNSSIASTPAAGNKITTTVTVSMDGYSKTFAANEITLTQE